MIETDDPYSTLPSEARQALANKRIADGWRFIRKYFIAFWLFTFLPQRIFDPGYCISALMQYALVPVFLVVVFRHWKFRTAANRQISRDSAPR